MWLYKKYVQLNLISKLNSSFINLIWFFYEEMVAMKGAGLPTS